MDELTYLESWAGLLEVVSKEQLPRAIDSIMLVTVQHHSDYRRRVLNETQQLPLSLLLIARSLPHVVCEVRSAVCAEVLATDNNDLHLTAYKLKIFFARELACARDSGRCPVCLFVIINMWCIKLPVSTQKIEGLNNMIVGMTKLCPSIELPLLSSRISGRQLAFPRAGFYKDLPRYSLIHSSIEEVVDRAVNYFHCVDAVLTKSRFETPLPSEETETEALALGRVVDPRLLPTVAQKWAASPNYRWAQAIRQNTKGWWLRGLVLLQEPPAEEGGSPVQHVWACSLMHRHYGELVKCKVNRYDGANGTVTSVSLVRPLTYERSLDVFARYFDFKNSDLEYSFGFGVWSHSPLAEGELREAAIAQQYVLGRFGEQPVRPERPRAGRIDLGPEFCVVL